MKFSTAVVLVAAIGLIAAVGDETRAASNGQMGGKQSGMTGQQMMAPGLVMPHMDAARGRHLFASKGCVVCHSINGVGGEDAPALDASTMPMPMNPFEFTAKMWRGAEAMVLMQREELGEQISLTGDELADIIAFVHNAKEQEKFSEADIPPRIRELIEHESEGEHHQDEDSHEKDEQKQ